MCQDHIFQVEKKRENQKMSPQNKTLAPDPTPTSINNKHIFLLCTHSEEVKKSQISSKTQSVLLTSLDPALLFLLSLDPLQSTPPANYDWEEGVDLYPSIHPSIHLDNK